MTGPLNLTLDYHITPEQTFTYLHLPFEVPAHITRIDVSYSYGDAIASDPTLKGGNTIDIGIVDPRGTQFMTSGFRGWSGSARQQFYVAEESATPGYLYGPIQPGTWHISLGAYKVAEAGCDCIVNILLTPSLTENHAVFPTLLPVRTEAPRPRSADGWYKGELHCHTVHSDGDSTPMEIVHLAESLGLDFLAITDHNNRSQLAALAQINTELTLIPGYEVTTYYGHWNIWGDGEWVDFRIQSPADLAQAIQGAQGYGYLVSCNHPRPYGPDWAFPEVEGYSCVEIWNGPWEVFNTACLAFWEARLNKGQRLVAVGGSDHHFSKQEHIARLGHPTTYIYCPDDPSAANLLQSLRAGHAFVTESPTGPRLDLRAGTAMMGDALVCHDPISCTLCVQGGTGSEVQICTAQGIVMRSSVTQDDQKFEFPVEPVAQYVRAQLIDPATGHCRAATNPIYLDSHE